VEGRVRQHTWKTPDGQKRHKHEVVAERVHFLGVRTQGADTAMPPEGADVSVPEEEEIPF
jgi:single-stranded DNA-binding protein